MENKKYTIQELAEISGFPIRTIRYYIQEGLVDPPPGRGRGGFYFDSHLKQLGRIKSLQERGMKLASIIKYLESAEPRELKPSRDLWARYEITPGLEVSVRRELEEEEGKKVQEIIRIAKSILEEGKNGQD